MQKTPNYSALYRPRPTRIRILLNPQRFLSETASPSTHIRCIRIVLNPLSRVESFESAICIWIRVDSKSGYLFIEWCNKINPNSLSWKANACFTMHALLPIFPEESWELECMQIRVLYVWTDKFDLKTDTCECGNFWIREVTVADSKISGYVWMGHYHSHRNPMLGTLDSTGSEHQAPFRFSSSTALTWYRTCKKYPTENVLFSNL